MNNTTAALNLLRLCAPYLVATAIYAISVLFLEEHYGDHIYTISGQIGSVFGLAVAFFLGFRMNTAYDRWWEGRKVIGELINNVRAFTAKIIAYYQEPIHLKPHVQAKNQELIQQLSNYLLAYIHQFKDQLQQQSNVEQYAHWLGNETQQLQRQSNPACHILLNLTQTIEQSMATTSALEKSDLMQFINRFYDIQGKAERINNTPFLLIYKILTRLMVYAYVLLIPLFIGDIDLGGESSGLEFLAIPIMVLISTTFLTIHRLSNLYAMPFSKEPTALPLAQLIGVMERDVQEMILSTKN